MKQRSPFRLAAALGAMALSLFLAACPQPIDGSVASRMTDRSLPSVSILSPIEGSSYAQTLLVQGLASDDGSLAEIRYAVSGVLGLLSSGAATIGPGGAFQFSVDTVAFSGPLAVVVEAVDWNGNVARASVSLAPGASSLSSFSAVASSKSVSLSWEPVSGATGYTVYWATGGSTPTVNSPGRATLAAGATSYDLSGLPNALLHTFMLKATTAAAGYWSGFVKALPLSSLTLAPSVSGGYGEIRLEWDGVDGVAGYEIYRAVDDPAGSFENLAGTVSGTSYVDEAVVDGHWYYYRVRADVAGAALSAANGAQTVPLPPVAERISGVTLPVTASRARSYSASGATTVYVASGSAGIAVVDASDPKRPVHVRTLSGLTNARDLEVATISGAPYLFVADGTGGLRAFSLASPTAPVLVGTLAGLDARQVAVAGTGTRVFVLDATGGTGIAAVGVSNPAAMALLGTAYSNATYDFSSGDLFVADSATYPSYDFIYATARNTVPANSNRREVLELYMSKSGATYTLWNAHYDANFNYDKLAVAGSYVYSLATRNTMLEPPPNYALFALNRYALSQAGLSAELRGYPAEIRVVGSKAYSVDAIGVQTWNVATPASPVNEENLNTQGSPTGIDATATSLFVASGINLFQSIDIAVPTGLATTASLGTYGAAGVALRGRYAYATTGSGAGSVLRVYDLVNPEAGVGALPAVAASAAIPFANKIALSGNYAFVTTSQGKLQVVDITNPLAPVLRGTGSSPSGSLNGLSVRGDYAYCAGSLGFQIFDVADPDLPILPALLDAEGLSMTDVALRGDRAYVTDGSYFQPNSLKIIDIADPRNPALLAKALTGAAIITGVELSGKWAFVTDGVPGAGLWAVDIDEASATFLTDYGPADTQAAGNSYAGALVLAGSWAFVLDDGSGLVQLDASDPVAYGASPPATNAGFIAQTAAIGTSGLADEALYGRYLVVADTSLGIKVVKLY